MSTRLLVDNLPRGITEIELRELFTPFGLVTRVSIIIDPDTGWPNGGAYVVMADDKAATQAIRQVNGKAFENEEITVVEARPREPRAGSGSGFRGDGHSGGWGLR